MLAGRLKKGKPKDLIYFACFLGHNLCILGVRLSSVIIPWCCYCTALHVPALIHIYKYLYSSLLIPSQWIDLLMSFNAELMHSEDLFCKGGTQPEKLFMNLGENESDDFNFMLIRCEILMAVLPTGCLFNTLVIEILSVGFRFNICLSTLMWKDAPIEWNEPYWNMLWISIRVCIKITIYIANKNTLVSSYQ